MNPNDAEMEQNNSARPLYPSILKGITYVQHLPTPFIATFMLIHLSAPALASVGGTDAASQVMLLGREYYQGDPQERLLVYLPLTVHIGASLIKRVAKLVHWIINKLKTSKNSKKGEALASIRTATASDVLVWTGYPLFLMLSSHITTHRLIPSNPSPPVYSISPSELDFTYVHFGLKHWPVRSWIMYSVLVGVGITHAIYGMPIVWRQTILRLLKKARIVGSDSRLGFSWHAMPKLGLVGIGIVLTGLLRISWEDVFISRLVAVRMLAAYRMSALYR